MLVSSSSLVLTYAVFFPGFGSFRPLPLAVFFGFGG